LAGLGLGFAAPEIGAQSLGFTGGSCRGVTFGFAGHVLSLGCHGMFKPGGSVDVKSGDVLPLPALGDIGGLPEALS